MHRPGLFLTIALFLILSVSSTPTSGYADDIDITLNRTLDRLEQEIWHAPGDKQMLIIIRSYGDLQTHAASAFSESVTEKLVDLLLERHLGRKKMAVFNWKSSRSTAPQAALPAKIVAYGDGHIRTQLTAPVDTGFLVTGSVALQGDDATITTELIDMTTGTLLTTVTETARITLPDPAAAPAGAVPPPPPLVAPPPGSPLPASPPAKAARLFIETTPGDTRITVLNIAEPFHQGMALDPGRYRVEVVAAGFDKKIESLVLPPGQDTRVLIRLEAAAPVEKTVFRVIRGTNYIFEGDTLDGRMHGQGKITFQSGASYDGAWRNNLQHGKGIYVYAGGDRLEGEWKNGKIDGSGTYFYKNGDRFAGEWKNQMKHGPGTYYFKNGDKWAGTYANDKKHGRGKYIWANGTEATELWENGKRLE